MAVKDILLQYYPLIAAFSAVSIGQILKLTIYLIEKRPISIRNLCSAGGMPSSHSAFASALTLAIAIKDGFDSSAFFLGLCLSLVILYDATGVRQAAGNQAKRLNLLLEEIGKSKDKEKLNEMIGHTQTEVIVGVIIGLSTALILAQV